MDCLYIAAEVKDLTVIEKMI